MRQHLISMTVGLWLTTFFVAFHNEPMFYGTWVCVGIAGTLSAGLFFTRQRTAK
ncbi:hypothetical protein [Vibrio sp. HA2012]|uniref:hypothetical protein n=1 Tax=Vibrio sp. HA2012 TaxID=1971595 RepID=UPI0012FE2BA9|nr:hypothetical protein [Vibrio sp. HA2012]